MKLSEFIEKYGDKKIDETELSKIIVGEEKYFIPELDEEYWFVDAIGGVDYFTNTHATHNENIIKHSRVFRTKEEAESEAVRQRVLLQMERDFLDNSDELDWENNNQEKLKFYYHGIHKRIFISSAFARNEGTLHTTNEEWLREYVKDNEANILKYYFEIKGNENEQKNE